MEVNIILQFIIQIYNCTAVTTKVHTAERRVYNSYYRTACTANTKSSQSLCTTYNSYYRTACTANTEGSSYCTTACTTSTNEL